MSNETWIAGAVEALAGGASVIAGPIEATPRQTLIETANYVAKPTVLAPSQPLSSAPSGQHHPKGTCAEEPEQGGHILRETQDHPAALPSSGSQPLADNPSASVTGTTIPRIVEEWRRRQDMLRARQRLELQAQAICRRYVDGDKVAAAKLWGEVRKDPGHDLRVWLSPFLLAIAPLDSAKKDIEKTLVKLSNELPITEWASGIRGLGELSLAALVGECGTGPGEYRTVSALWKRMGLAVVNGGRQRRIAGAEALDHGYNAERRSLMWNIGGSIMKAQLRSEKGDAGKKVEGSEHSLGELGQVYLDRKAYLRARDPERSKAHIHNDAKRYMEKRLLRQLWQEWRRATGIVTPFLTMPAAETLEAA